MSKDQIYNPETKRCVNIDGAAGRSIVKKYKAEDVKKLKKKATVMSQKNVKSKLKTRSSKSPMLKNMKGGSVKKKKSIIKEPANVTKINKISENVKTRLRNYLKQIKKQRRIEYINEGHRKACAEGNMSKLTKPIERFTKTLEYSQVYNPNANRMSFKDLDADNIKLNHGESLPMRFRYNNYNKSISLNVFDPESEYAVDTEWFADMNNYIESLSKEDMFTVLGYTMHGDKLVNNYLRGQFDYREFYPSLGDTATTWTSSYMPLFFQAKHVIHDDKFIPKKYVYHNHVVQLLETPPNVRYDKRLTKKPLRVNDLLELLHNHKDLPNSSIYMALASCGWNLERNFWNESIEMFSKDLNRIIKKSPALKRRMVVFRGVKDDYYLKGSKNFFYKNSGFVSTSLSHRLANGFMNNDDIKDNTICCLKRIVLLPGTHVLFISGLSRFPNEMEILMSTDSVYVIKNAKRTLPSYNNEISKINDVCGENLYKLLMTDIIVVK
jgi:hypothetical protein